MKKISLHKSKWFLKSVQWLDWEDVAQIIRIHIYKKMEYVGSKKVSRSLVEYNNIKPNKKLTS